MDSMERHREALERFGGSTAQVDALVAAILSATDIDALPALFVELRAAANRLDFLFDTDYAACALQAGIGAVASTGLREQILGFALERARWCASCASSGGEGTARMQHVYEIEALLAHSAGGGSAPPAVDGKALDPARRSASGTASAAGRPFWKFW